MNTLNPPAIVRTVDELERLAGQIRGAYSAGEQALQKGVHFMRQVGAMLILAKGRCGHGAWGTWVEENLPFGIRQAENYMKLHRDEVLKSEVSAHLDAALRTIAEDPSEESGRSDESTPGNRASKRKKAKRVKETGFVEELLSHVTALSSEFTSAMSGDSEEAKKLHEYLSQAGLVWHEDKDTDQGKIRKATFIALKGVHKVVELVRYPGRKSPEEIKQTFLEASGGWVPPMIERYRQKRKSRR